MALDGRPYWFFFDAQGYIMSGWQAVGPYIYYLDTTPGVTFGAMATGWKLLDGKWYYFDPTPGTTMGAMLRNVTTPDGHRVGEDGVWIQE